ncbi:Deoxycytidylate deaminase [Bosea lathyri]|uniref:Deoxycytidylate deaminase n=2 Tax=Bosea lathyri TaxID=1036778 RepID=A0A1H6AVX1_9HYPH|nr:Deoxycytidylate deaminase [Bosea lathyri]
MHRVGLSVPRIDPFDQYIEIMQTAGNALREKFGGDYLAGKIIEQIFKFREKNGGFDGKISIPGRRAYIIDSLKNTDELQLLRKIYGETLCILGVFAPDSIRKSRLTDNGIPHAQIDKIIDRDQGELATFGQKTRKIFVHSDFFVCNDQRKEELRNRVDRNLSLIFDTDIHTPTRAESAMYKASAAAANSACMSRQVGASIVSKDGELIAVGWNDVPRFGGGLYTEDDRSFLNKSTGKLSDRDNRCFKWGGCICHNETRRQSMVSDVVKRVSEAGILKKGVKESDVIKALRGTDIDSLIEFSRSIHAEMEAILSVAREGKNSLVGATLYTNTYPCHNCARHIVAAGISSVVYIEPYLKSLATKLHYDAITEEPNDETKVVFRQYDGVAPHTYLRLFRPEAERKLSGKRALKDPAAALPIFRIQLDAQADYESKVIADLSDKEHTPISAN